MASEFGRFIGDVITKWLIEDGQDRRMEVLEDFSFEDPATKLWTTPAGTQVDGASIPRALWTIVGSPFTDDYRRASVVHDYYCDVRTEPYDAVHLMFYYACRADGVSALKANMLYYGVVAGGPSWHVVRIVNFNVLAPRTGTEEAIDFTDILVLKPPVDEARLQEDVRWIAETNPTLPEIWARAQAARLQPAPPPVLQLPYETVPQNLPRIYAEELRSRALFSTTTELAPIN
jgi:hypothetical protein